ncbi:MAG TPA: hypothetical protein VFV58_34815 [Blastocatellia bacterium]|jgi:hypothetical protein|nr:hypothetical protein [Blastocatellia bacterium]
MPDDFDPVAWLENQKKSAPQQPVKASGDFDPVAWLENQQKPKSDQMRFDLSGGPKTANMDALIPNQSLGFDYRANARNQAARAAFKAQSFTDRVSERAYDALARGGGALARQGTTLLKAIGGGSVPGGAYALGKLDEFQAQRNAELEAQRQGRPEGDFLTQVGEGVLEAAPQVAAAGMLTTAGVPPVVAGGGMSALGANWQDPKRAAIETAIGALAPVAGGAIGSKLGASAAARLSRPAVQAAARVAGEIGGGAAGNVIGQGGAELAFEGRLNPRELAKAAALGAVLSAPGAVAAGLPTKTRIPFREAAPTERLVYPDAPATTEMPALSRAQIENAPTSADLAARVPSSQLPIRRPINTADLEPIQSAPLGELSVQANDNTQEFRPGVYAGPRAATELAFSTAPQRRPQAQAQLPPPIPPVSMRNARQQPLFPGAPNVSTRTPPLEVVSALRKAGLLTGLKTHARNIVGNLSFQPVEEISKIPASIADMAASVFTGRRTITGASPTAMAKSAYDAATTGVKEAGQILRRGMTSQQAQSLQLGQEINSGSKIIDTYVNGVFRTLGAEDAVFRRFALSRAIADRSRAAALTEVRQGKISRAQVESRARQLASDPAIQADAIGDAEVATFNNENTVNTFLNAGRQKLAGTQSGRAANFAIDQVFPFTKTPTNIVARLLDYTGVGFGGQVAKAIVNRSFTPAQQRAFATTFGRGVTGAGLIMLGWKLHQAGVLTGFADTDPDQRNRDTASGRTPGAVLNPYTNTWHQIAAFTPVGALLTLGATLDREWNRPLKNESKRGGNVAAAAVTQTVAQQPLLTGAKDISEAITRPGSVSERAGRIAGSFVPTIVSDVGDLTDSERREGKGFAAQVERRIPGLRNSLPPATDVLGRPLEARKTNFFDPTLTSSAKDKTEPLMRELVRLDVGLSAPHQNEDESLKDYTERKAKAGAMIEQYGAKLMASRSYQNATKDEQKAAWRKLQTAIHAESDEAYPNTEKFDAMTILEGIRESASRKRERQLESKQK